jgi:hypothetical protein
MRQWVRVLIAVVIVSFTIGAARWVFAQIVAVNPVTPTVLTGGDFGFRVEGDRAGTPVGELVVKVNGQWVVADLNATGLPKRITAK